MNTKTIDAQIKMLCKDGESGGTAETGRFEALVSVFDNRDSYGDVIRKGAFAATLADWDAKGLPIPIYYSHRLDDPDMNIGHVISATETDKGLQVIGQLDLDMPKAETVHRLFKSQRLSQFSFSYAVTDGGVKTDPDTDQEFFELRALDLYEIGPTPVGANPETELIAVKDAGFVARKMERRIRAAAVESKAGRMVSEANLNTLKSASDALGSAKDAIDGVISAAEATSDGTNAASNGTGSSKAEEPARVKAEDSDRRALSAMGVDTPLTPSAALNALLLADIRSLDDNFHYQGTA